jgi:hypothetical protein
MKSHFRKIQWKSLKSFYFGTALLIVSALLLTGTTALAQPPVIQVNINAGTNMNGVYASAISSLRNTAAFPISGNTRMTNGTASEQQAGLIELRITDTDTYINGPQFTGNPSVSLWITTDNLYVRGFSNTLGQAFAFFEAGTPNSTGYALSEGFDFNGLPTATQLLPFSSNYNDLSRAASLGRESLTFSLQSLRNSIFTLGFAGINSQSTNQAIAEALMLQIQYFSEGARFYDVYGYVGQSLDPTAGPLNGLPLWLQYLENSWASISNYMASALSNSNTPPLTVNGIARDNSSTPVVIASFAQASGLVAVVLNTARVNEPDMGGLPGDWNHDEL